jgi:fructokinase
VGGGVSREPRLYASVPQLLPRYVYSPVVETPIVPAKFGDASGVRGRGDVVAPIASAS